MSHASGQLNLNAGCFERGSNKNGMQETIFFAMIDSVDSQARVITLKE